MARGPHASDPELFGPEQLPRLRAAVADLSWLLGRGYAETSSVALVGDRYRLRKRQRIAVRRCACADDALTGRLKRRVEVSALHGRRVAVDGFNAIIILETALAGGVLLRGRDRVLRDLASVHGSYRRVAATANAIELVCNALAQARPGSVTWYLDRPVSNSGRLRRWIEEAAPADLPWSVELPFDPDKELMNELEGVVVSADAIVLDGCGSWSDLVSLIVKQAVADAWVVDLA